MAGNGSPRRAMPARRMLVGISRIVALLAIIIGACGVLAPALTRSPAFYLAAVLFAVTSFVLLRPRQATVPSATAFLPPAPAPPATVVVDESRIAAAREEERARWAAEVAKSVDAVHRSRLELKASEDARAAVTRNVDELTQTLLALRQQLANQQAAATQQVVRADTLVAELNAELTAAREAAETLRGQYASKAEELQRAASSAVEEIQQVRSAHDDLQRTTAQRETEWGEKLQKVIDGLEADHERERSARDKKIHELQRTVESERGIREQVEELARELQQQLGHAAAAQGDIHRAMDGERSRVAALQQALDDERAARALAEAQARETSARVDALDRHLASAHDTHAEQTRAIAGHENTIGEAVQQRDAARSQAEELATRVEELQQRVVGERATHEQRESEWNASLQKIIAGMAADHENDIGEVTEQREAARAEARALTARVTELQDALDAERATRERREAEWNDKVQTIVAGMAADHANDIGQAMEQREAARADVLSLTARLAELQQLVDGERAAHQQHESEWNEKHEHALEAGRIAREQLETEWNEKLQHIVAGMAADHENDIGEAMQRREAARAESRELTQHLAEARQTIERERASHDQRESEWNEKLQKIVAGLAADHENDIGGATMEREAARAEARHLTLRLQELQRQIEEHRANVVDESALREKLDSEWSAKLQTIVSHLASDHDEDIGKAVEEKEEARAEARTMSMKIGVLQQQIERDRQLFMAAEEKWNGLHETLTAKANAAQQALESMPSQHVEPPLSDPFPAVMLPTPEPFPSPFNFPPGDDAQRARADVLEIAEQAHAVLKRSSPGTVPIPRDERRTLILFVHHDPNMRTMWRDQLHKNGYDVLTAADGLEGLRIATAQKPGVVIADAQMPKMDGRELCQLLKSNEQTAAMKVVLMSGLLTNEVSKGFQPDELLRKPVKFEALQNALTSLLS